MSASHQPPIAVSANAPLPPRITAVAADRAELWDAGFRPLAVYGHDVQRIAAKDRGKRPKGDDWQLRARLDTPEAAEATPAADALNTGVLCDGLRALDLDIDDPSAVAQLRALAFSTLGETPVRFRDNSPRCLLLYAAAEGEPAKRVLPGKLGKVEVLGRGQQFVALGIHPSGAPLRWTPAAPMTVARDTLPTVTEAQVTAFLVAAATIIGAPEPVAPTASGFGLFPHAPSAHGAEADHLDVAAALAVMPNDGGPDWEAWNRIGMAAWAATAGSMSGFAAWSAWSERNPVHDPAACQERWVHYGKAPPSSIGAGTLFRLARETRPNWSKPSDAAPKNTPSTDEFAAVIAAVVERFNRLYLMVNEAGKATIYQPGFDPVLRRRRFDRLTPRDLQTLYMNERIQVGLGENDKPLYRGVADVWLRHPDRRQFIRGVTFDPTMKDQPGVLNLWEGYGVTPAPGDWSLMKTHIRDIICAGDRIRYVYLIKWLGRMLQHPDEAGEVAVVMKGGEGCGKGTLAKAVKRVVGQHALAISNAKHLVGNFNAHLRDVVFLFADEAFFAGDRAHVGVLKSIITEPHLTVEAKYANAVEVPNFLHVMMASNEEWVVPAAMDSRRFFVLDVPDTVVGKHEHFEGIWKQMEAGGYEAMLHDLLWVDLTGFNVRNVPTTEGLQEQRKLSLGTTEAWWLDCLERGYVFRSKLGLEDEFRTWHPKIGTDLLFASYEEFARSRNERRPISREGLGRFLTGMKAEATRLRGGVVGEHLTDVDNIHGGSTRKAQLVKQDRATGYIVGTIEQARTRFVTATGLAIIWDGGAVDE